MEAPLGDCFLEVVSNLTKNSPVFFQLQLGRENLKELEAFLNFSTAVQDVQKALAKEAGIVWVPARPMSYGKSF